MIQFIRLDLFDLKKLAQPHFAKLDVATQNNDTRAAKSSRQAIQTLAREALRSFSASSFPGIYMFCDRNTENDWGDLRYIGCTNGSLFTRLMDWFKHDSALDAALALLREDDARNRAYTRMRCSMNTTEAGLEKYCNQHQHALKVMAGDSLFLAAFDKDASFMIDTVESTLIATAWVNRAPLINAEARKLPDPELRDIVSELAQQVLAGWAQAGLGSPLVDRFKRALTAVAD